MAPKDSARASFRSSMSTAMILAAPARRAPAIAASPTPPQAFALTDLWSGGTSSTSGQISANVPAHGVAVLRMTGGSPGASTTARLRGTGSGRCLDVDRAATAAGTTTLIWDCHTPPTSSGPRGPEAGSASTATSAWTPPARAPPTAHGSSSGPATARTTRSGPRSPTRRPAAQGSARPEEGSPTTASQARGLPSSPGTGTSQPSGNQASSRSGNALRPEDVCTHEATPSQTSSTSRCDTTDIPPPGLQWLTALTSRCRCRRGSERPG